MVWDLWKSYARTFRCLALLRWERTSGKGVMRAIVGSNVYCSLLSSKSPLLCIVGKQWKDHTPWSLNYCFFTNLKPYLWPADKNVVAFSSCFMHYHLDMRLLQGNHNMFCDIHIFSATTAEALLFCIQELIIVECSGHVQIKFYVVFLCKENFALFFCAKKILCGVFMGK